ncbi:MAG: glycosyltransferase family 2 protein [Altererythrobacter sp.]|nr:glycosyltransferase family 2 protein [Altererythrobacter sp.]
MVEAPLPRTGVVAIGRNEGERLKRCLASLRDSGYPVVYVDSASTDGSPEVAAALGAKVHALDLSRPFTAARARAEGLAVLEDDHPALDHVFFVDGDCEVEPGFLAAATAFLDAEPAFAVVCGRRRERFPDASRYNRLMDREWDTPVGEAAACGGDALFRLAAYHRAGGYDPAMVAGEEPELCTRIRAGGGRVMRLDLPMTIHDAAITRFGQWWRRAIRSGMGYAQAWSETNGRLYGRELARAFGWSAALPLSAALAALAWHPAWMLLWPGLTALQFVRLARRDGIFAGALSVVGKYAELVGSLRYIARAALGRAGSTVHYK